jgi:hypothetical protein
MPLSCRSIFDPDQVDADISHDLHFEVLGTARKTIKKSCACRGKL